MIKKHIEFRNVPEKIMDNGGRAPPREYSRDTGHICSGKNNMYTIFSYVLFGSICPFCKEQILVVE